MSTRAVTFGMVISLVIAGVVHAGSNCGPNRLVMFAGFQTCISGHGLPPLDPNCLNFDFDDDFDVDLADYVGFLKPTFGTDPYAIATNLRAAALGDLDADGDRDLVVAGDQIYVLLNQGDGSFAPPAPFPAGVTNRSPVIVDLDGNSAGDVIVADSGSANIWILLNEGGGTFGQALNIPVSGPTSSVAAADLDGDSDIDFAATRWFNPEAFILENQGAAGFAATVLPQVGFSKLSMTAADLDGDEDIDLAAVDQPHDAVRWLNNGGGSFSGTEFFAGDSLAQLAIGDLDHDADADFALAMIPYVSVLLNDGDAGFSPPSFYFMGGDIVSLVSIALADLDSDGDLDAAGANQPGGSMVYSLNDGSAMFSSGTGVPSGTSTRWVVAADLDGDADPDVVTVNAATVTVMLNGCVP